MDPKKTGPGDIIREGLHKDYRATRECRAWELDIDVSNRAEGEVFTLVTHAIFWNGFQTGGVYPDYQWAATAVGSPSISRSEFGVILPREKLVKSWSQWKYSSVVEAQPENRLKAGAPPPKVSGMLYWPIAQIDPGYTYEIRWTW